MLSYRIISQIFQATILFLILYLSSCTNKPDALAGVNKEILPEEKNTVEVVTLAEKDFLKEIVSNGKLSASQQAELYFEVSGPIASINVQNGNTINENDVIARLNNETYRLNMKKADLTMEQAKIDKLDALIGMGYSTTDTVYSAEHEAIADIRSGYNQAQVTFEEARLQLAKTELKAPFSGKVSGIKQKPFEQANMSEPFCTLINDRRFYIDFPLLETEISKVKLGQDVTISPISGATNTTGKICEIDPKIDENGLIWLKAEVDNPGQYLQGMNVKVSIKQAISDQLVVPKEAVVLRQNREVLFRYTQGIAYWTYIKVLNENEHEYAVAAAEGATLSAGDTVIVSNNLNLAHESEVEITN
ncbi:efflux RND transporter periplasmic adaptor subunit [Draconibacterium sp. IB214405]|uniref:efflux RND transporter periplasmic adaptor subunit n=1 Tax=Draconibacterium sp. IB214405 TaxID=3097352 RepID=UPI002A12FB83|nr:efflux RND transporter periplasmic adaptor subunit [Draconibacterium sp. IB214405]MDX8339744.1 efflux RND transporter periplasmic adaptor subunit [Draconibacterium sp. IB214405]